MLASTDILYILYRHGGNLNPSGFIKVIMAYRISKLILVTALILAAFPVIAQPLPQHYILFLEDAPVAQRIAAGEQAQSATARNYQQQIEAKQQSLKNELASRNIQVTGSVSTVLNAIFVVAPKTRLGELKALPGVAGVVAGRRYHLNLNRATALVDAPAAWTALGGIQNAGAGIKIGMIDTGIDQTHPAFQDSSLTAPAGFPICKTAYPNGSEVAIANCSAFTNNKVIVARSYVPLDAAGSDPNNPAADSAPDDYTPRDRVGHGTGTASAAAGVSNTGPTGITFNGVAPKAFLGNYKVFGSPEVNDGAADDAIIQAVEDALSDGMNIASLSLGGPALSGPLDTGATCGNPTGVPCDPLAMAVNNAVQAGMLVVIAAGNDGDGASSLNNPNIETLSTIESPGDTPLAIGVGSTTNSHYILDGVEVLGSGVPSNLQQIQGVLGDGPPPSTAAAPLRDVTQLGDNGLACGSPFAAGSLAGAIALIERGTCNFTVKVTNAQSGGAVGVVFYMATQDAPISAACQGPTSNLPCIMIGNSDGVNLKSFIDSNPGYSALIIQDAFEVNKSSYNLLSLYSSQGPTTGDNAIKPDLVATGGSDDFGTDIYLAAQDYDPLGGLYSATRYTAGSGTSFATPLVSGAAALVKQAHPNFSPAQIKSALVNSGSQVITSDENGDAVGVQQLGGGLLDANAARQSTIAVNPSNFSFGVPSALPVTKSVQITNGGSSSASLALAVTPVTATGVNLTLSQQSLTLAAGVSGTISLTLSGSIPAAGSYSGFVNITQSGASTVSVPYMFLVGSGNVTNIIALSGPSDSAPGTDAGPIIVRLIDANGVPVSGVTVGFTATGGASVQSIQSTTDNYGIASAEAFLGSQVTSYNFDVRIGRESYELTADAIAQPTTTASGVVDGATFAVGKPIAPGSYITIFGSTLAGGATDSATTSILPLAIDNVTVSFDVPSAQLSVPGYLVYVSDSQVNLQAPWELQGQSSVQIKVTVGDGFGVAYGNVVTVPLANYSPGFFGGAQVAALDTNSNVITPSNPATRGQVVELFANGLGPVSNQPASGNPALASPLSMCQSSATVMIGNQPASVGFCGLAPGFPGLYQVNATVPTSLTPGTYPITVAIGGVTSPASSIAVR
jgi:minor extracellular serine protease Vpr